MQINCKWNNHGTGTEHQYSIAMMNSPPLNSFNWIKDSFDSFHWNQKIIMKNFNYDKLMFYFLFLQWHPRMVSIFKIDLFNVKWIFIHFKKISVEVRCTQWTIYWWRTWCQWCRLFLLSWSPKSWLTRNIQSFLIVQSSKCWFHC